MQICEAARSCLRKYLRHRLLELIRDIPVVIEEVSVLSSLIAGSCSLGPCVVLACMVHYKVEADSYTSSVACSSQILKIIHSSQIRSYLAEIRNSISAVAALIVRRIQKRHEVKVFDTALLEIRKLLS